MKTIIAKSILLPFVVAATIPVVTYAGEVITPKKSVPIASTPQPTTPQGNPKTGSTGSSKEFLRNQFDTVTTDKVQWGSPGHPAGGDGGTGKVPKLNPNSKFIQRDHQ